MTQEPQAPRSAFPLRWLIVFIALIALGFGIREYFILRNRTAAIAYLNKTGGEIRYSTPPPAWYPEWLPFRDSLGWVERIHMGKDDCELGYVLPLQETRDLVLFGDLRAEGLRAVSRFPQLKSISFQASNLTDTGIEHIRGCRKLDHLLISSKSLTDEGLKSLVDLPITSLNLSDVPITDAGLQSLAGLPLVSLHLNDSRVTDAGLEYLIGLPLKSLGLRESKITDAGMAHLAKIPTLSTLNLENTGVGDVGLEHLARLPLVNLSLENTRITDAGLPRLKGMPLKKLTLTDTAVTVEGVRVLCDVRTLERVVTYTLGAEERAELRAAGLPMFRNMGDRVGE